MKVLTIQMPDGWVWGVPAEVIARSYANHYDDEPDAFDEAMESDDTLKDWAANNINWNEVAPFAIKIRPWRDDAGLDWQEEWMNGKRAIEEITQ